MAITMVGRLAVERMANAASREFLRRHRLTLDGASTVLGTSRRQAAYYAKDKPVSRLVALACCGYERVRLQSRRRGVFLRLLRCGEIRVTADLPWRADDRPLSPRPGWIGNIRTAAPHEAAS